MLYGAILPGEERFDEVRWHDEELEKCEDLEALWGYLIRNFEVLYRIRKDMADDVLYCVFKMGITDWVVQKLHSPVDAARMSTTMGLRLLQRIIALEKKVTVFSNMFV